MTHTGILGMSCSPPQDRLSRAMVVQDNSADEFLKNAGDLLYKDEAVNSLMLGLAEDMLTRPSHLSKEPPWYLRVVDTQGKTLTAALRTPPMNLILTYADKPELAELADYVLRRTPELPGLTGPSESVDNFSELWFARTGRRGEVAMHSKIYQAERMKIPTDVTGYLRHFRDDEFDLALRWMKEFCAEALPNEKRSEEVWLKSVERVLEKKAGYVWMHNDEPVAMTHVSRPTRDTVTINYVYTPKHLRQRGFASALVARLSEKMLEDKRYCVLYTDLANPTSNKIYQNIGYEEVTESKYVIFK